MSFSDKLKLVRTKNGMTQEQLAQELSVSRQAVSRWESGAGYPETEKLLMISKMFSVSLDYLMLDEENMPAEEERSAAVCPSGKISVCAFDKSSVTACHAFKISDILSPAKGEPKCILNGIDRITFWGEHSVLLGWYAEKEDAEKELKEISKAIDRGEATYKLKYCADVEYVGIFGQPRIKK